MKKKISYSLLFSALTLCSISAMEAQETQTRTAAQTKTIDVITEIAKSLQQVPASYHDKLMTAQDSTTVTNESLIALVTETTQLLNFNDSEFLDKKDRLLSLKRNLIAELEDFKITGFSFAIDPNLACIVETRDPNFSVDFVDSKGQKRSKNFELKFDTVGLKLQIGVSCDAIFFVNTDLNFYNMNKEVKLGMGFEISSGLMTFLLGRSIIPDVLNIFTPAASLAYIPFTNTKGGMIIASITEFNFEIASLITGGTLRPAIDQVI